MKPLDLLPERLHTGTTHVKRLRPLAAEVPR